MSTQMIIVITFKVKYDCQKANITRFMLNDNAHTSDGTAKLKK
jgi:hypothetical protein